MNVTNQTQIFKSQEDASVNFIIRGDYPGYQEARYVRRRPDYMIVYVSSQSGCNQNCKFCHLTATKQTQKIDLSVDQIFDQAKQVLAWAHDNEPKAELCHINAMARGEFFNNVNILEDGHNLVTKLNNLVTSYGMKSKILISTIMPKQWLKDYCNETRGLANIFTEKGKTKPEVAPIIYYSLYSLNEDFRKQWIPSAVDYQTAFRWLQDYQNTTQQNIKLHWALIKNQNDSEQETRNIIDYIKTNHPKLKFGINLVRYNPYSVIYGEESSENVIQARLLQLKDAFPESKIKVVERVGRDVAASCGMFSNKKGLID